MSKFYHLGDSFSTAGNSKSFGKFISEYYDLDFHYRGEQGSCNDQIFNKLLSINNEITKGDFLLINFSFFIRFYTTNHNLELVSTNYYYEEIKKSKQYNFDSFFKDKSVILNYFTEFNYEYNLKLFKSIEIYLNSLCDRGIKVFCVFIKKDDLNYGNKIIKPNEYGFKIPNELNFDLDYFSWLVQKKWYREDTEEFSVSGHYIEGIQEELAKEYIKRIECI
jgi:hypothetical protein